MGENNRLDAVSSTGSAYARTPEQVLGAGKTVVDHAKYRSKASIKEQQDLLKMLGIIHFISVRVKKKTGKSGTSSPVHSEVYTRSYGQPYELANGSED